MEPGVYFQFVAALVFVLALIAALAWAVRRSGLGGRLLPAASRGDQPRRLSVEEVLPLDSRRKLVLLRCDEREHLVLLNQGPAPDLLLSGSLPSSLAERGAL